MTLSQLISILSASVAPVTLISGVGLLMLSMNNRYARVIDMSREIVRELDSKNSNRAATVKQLRIFFRRAQLMRSAIFFGAVSIFFVALTMGTLFLTQLFGVQSSYVGLLAFALSLASLTVSIGFYIRDISVSLQALKLELSEYL
jgi:hypothetical protein